MNFKSIFLTLVLFCTLTPIFSQVFINEVMISNTETLADADGEYDDWIEIYNNSNNSINLADYYISDNLSNPTKWQIPNTNNVLTTVPANGYLILWADEDHLQGENHVDFKLNNSGESLILSLPDGVTVLDSITVPDLSSDQSYGRLEDGGNLWDIFVIPSPNANNNESQPQLNQPVISPPSGLYTGNQLITITADPGSMIYYTTDGGEPSASDNLYNDPFEISTTAPVKAIAIQDGFMNSKITGNSYINNSTTELPILHISIDPTYLWDDELGMYVVGANGVKGPCQNSPRNWNQDWEYQAYATLFEKDGTVAFNEGCGLSISGGCSRGGTQKSFNVAFKNQYGVGTLDYKLFENKEETEWEGFKIRSGGNHRLGHRIVDATLQKVIEGELDIDLQSSRPVAMYLNNEYWGLYNIRDRLNSGYVETHHPEVNADSLDLIKLPKATGLTWHWIYESVSEGDNIDYYTLEDYMTVNSLADENHYNYVKTKIDINSFLDYIIANIYYNNADWPGNNLRTWRERSPDGKWRWLMSDLDAMFWSGGASSVKLLDEVLNSTANNQRSPLATNMIRQLMENDEFKAEYIQRCNTYINTVWLPSRVQTIFDDVKSETGTEIQADFDKWGGWNYTTWNTNVNAINDFFSIRPDVMKTMMDNVLNVSGRFNLNINFNQNTKGTVLLHNNRSDIPFNYIGEYHDNISIKIQAIPNLGYRFAYWQETGDTNPILYQSFSENTTLTPVFEPSSDLIINEIHYNPNDPDNRKEFIEIYNPDTLSRNISHYNFKSGINFEFPEETLIDAGEYIIIAEDASQYEGNGYQVFEWQNGGLDENGEHLVLQNPIYQIIDSILYNDKNPWDEAPDGEGFSLELLHPTFDNNEALNWFRSDNINGTPGAENSRTCIVSDLSIIINEINYNSDNDNFDAGDWVELYNPTPNPIDLSGWSFYNNDNVFVFPDGINISGNSYLVIVEDTVTFSAVFPDLPSQHYLGNFSFSLSNKGERLSLFENNKCLVDYVIYDDNLPWPIEADGNGATLSLIDHGADNAMADYWEASDSLNSYSIYGSPGKSNLCPGIITYPILCNQIITSEDDAEEKNSDGSVTISSSDLDLVNDDGVIFKVGMRFQNINIPDGATITSATIQFAADEVNIDETNITFRGEDIDNAPPFEAIINHISNRNTTSSSIIWQPEPWDAIGNNHSDQKTNDLSPIIQEIIDRPDFISGNAIAIIAEGTGIRTAESFDGTAELAPKLCITYTTGQCVVNAKIWLEGFYDEANNNMHTKLKDNDLLPLSQPFNTSPWNYEGTETVSSFPENIVDWILIMRRDIDGNILEQAAGFLNQDGALMSLDGSFGISLPIIRGDYISIHHRSHLDILSSNSYDGISYDFTNSVDQAQGGEQLKLIDGKYMLYAGDFDGKGIINSDDFNNWKTQGALINQYIPIDGDGNGIVNVMDFNLWIKNRSKVGHPSIRY